MKHAIIILENTNIIDNFCIKKESNSFQASKICPFVLILINQCSILYTYTYIC